MSTALLALFIALFLAGCQLSLPRAVVVVPPIEAVLTAMPATEVPLGRLDCDRDGLASYAELQAGFEVNGRAVTRAEFEAHDADGDAHWNERELRAFLARGFSSWSAAGTCAE